MAFVILFLSGGGLMRSLISTLNRYHIIIKEICLHIKRMR